MSSGSQEGGDNAYKPVERHWFYKKDIEDRIVWRPFSYIDSNNLEAAFTSQNSGSDTIVATDGGRYDVIISKRERSAVYWRENNTQVRRCSWFYKGTSDARYIPYAEDVADTIEEEFRLGIITSTWNRKINLPEGESIVLHSPTTMVHFLKSNSPDSWGNTPLTAAGRAVQRGVEWCEKIEPGEAVGGPVDHLLLVVHGIGEPTKSCDKPQAAARARAVKRGVGGSDIPEGETNITDHLMLIVHGIGPACDLKLRSIEEVVDDFRFIGQQLLQSHYKSSCDQGLTSRIEILPISWHWNLHSEETGIDKRLKQITLESVPKLRGFTNDTLLDILFYTSPKFCQTIMETVGSEINRIYGLFKKRNPQFKGDVSLSGHSLGSVILFDLLCNQKPQDPVSPVKWDEKPPLTKQLSYVMGAAGTGQPCVVYPQLVFHPKAFFALGSPIGMFVCVRGLETLGEDFKLPTCDSFFNIFHPFDPVAYRIESLINSELSVLQPVLIPHHKGRKRMHLELRDTVTRVGADIKQRLMDSVKNTWESFYHIATLSSPREAALQERVKEVIEEELVKEAVLESASEPPETPDINEPIDEKLLKKLGKLNSGRRVDYVLQEAPFELFNEYIFALASHVCYWESEDTVLLILKEIYSKMGVEPDRQVPQQTLTIERPLPGTPEGTAEESLTKQSP